jgi:hypothetical protein
MNKLQGLVRQEELGKFKNSPHRDSNPRPSDQHKMLEKFIPKGDKVIEVTKVI